MPNKAHTTTLNRICRRYGVVPDPNGAFDLRIADAIIEVETSATIDDAILRLQTEPGAVYIALTNKEGVSYAVKRVAHTKVGIMDPQGNVVKPSGDHVFPSG